MRPVPPSGWPFRSFTWSRRRQTGRFLSLSTVDWRTSRLSSSVRVIWPGMASAGVRWCVVFQVVKTAQSRERTGRTLFTALSQLLWRDKGRAVWFSLGENHAVISALRRRPRGAQECCGQGDPSLLMSHYGLLHQVIMPTSADAFPVVGGRCTGRARRCKAKQGRRGKTALTCGYLLPQ